MGDLDGVRLDPGGGVVVGGVYVGEVGEVGGGDAAGRGRG